LLAAEVEDAVFALIDPSTSKAASAKKRSLIGLDRKLQDCKKLRKAIQDKIKRLPVQKISRMISLQEAHSTSNSGTRRNR